MEVLISIQDGSAIRNLTVTNNGTINATKRYGVYIEDAEQVTITNNAGATIKTYGQERQQMSKEQYMETIWVIVIAEIVTIV